MYIGTLHTLHDDIKVEWGPQGSGPLPPYLVAGPVPIISPMYRYSADCSRLNQHLYLYLTLPNLYTRLARSGISPTNGTVAFREAEPIPSSSENQKATRISTWPGEANISFHNEHTLYTAICGRWCMSNVSHITRLLIEGVKSPQNISLVSSASQSCLLDKLSRYAFCEQRQRGR